MGKLGGKLRELVRSEEGATGVEYGLLVAAIAAVIVVAVYSIGDKVGKAFDKVDKAMK